MKSVYSHLWYLTEQLVVLALWDKGVPDEERKAIANRLLITEQPEHITTGKPVFPNHLLNNDIAIPDLNEFVWKKSWLLFQFFSIPHNWLSIPVFTWNGNEGYRKGLQILKNMLVVIDCPERCIKNITEYANYTKDSAHRDNTLLVVNSHRDKINDISKVNLNRLNQHE